MPNRLETVSEDGDLSNNKGPPAKRSNDAGSNRTAKRLKRVQPSLKKAGERWANIWIPALRGMIADYVLVGLPVDDLLDVVQKWQFIAGVVREMESPSQSSSI